MQYLSYALLICCVIGILLMIVSYFIFISHRKEYSAILESYLASKLEFPMLYNIQSMTGFFGAYPVSRFFLGLKRKIKKSFSSQKESNAYSFFLQKPTLSIEWMKKFCFFLEDIGNVSSYSLYYRFNYSRTKFGITFVFFTISKSASNVSSRFKSKPLSAKNGF